MLEEVKELLEKKNFSELHEYLEKVNSADIPRVI